MPGYEQRSREDRGGRSDSRGGFGGGRGRDRNDSSGGRRDRFSRDGGRGRSDRSENVRTQVTCSSCGVDCEVPFKPTSSKPVYCSECYSKEGSGSSRSNNNSSKDLDIINEKLDKIMKALKLD